MQSILPDCGVGKCPAENLEARLERKLGNVLCTPVQKVVGTDHGVVFRQGRVAQMRAYEALLRTQPELT
jgi:hypothetical protein